MCVELNDRRGVRRRTRGVINCWGRSWRWCVRRVNMDRKNGRQWCVLGKRGRMCDQIRDRRCDRRCTRGVKGR
jgi:hypothetical protein